MTTTEQINALLHKLSQVYSKSHERGPEGLEVRAEKEVTILGELVSLMPYSRSFRYRLMMAESNAHRARSIRQEQRNQYA